MSYSYLPASMKWFIMEINDVLVQGEQGYFIMKKHILIIGALMVFLFATVFSVTTCADTETKATVKVGKKSFKAVLYDNETTKALEKKLPIKYKMSDLNGNEKYKYLSYDLPTKEKKVRKIKAGDIMLYGDDCLVVFYKSFKTSYKYTKVGKITNTKGLKKAAGKGKVTVSISLKKQEPEGGQEENVKKTMKLYINDQKVDVSWADNESVAKLRDLAEEKALEIRTSGYGGFEQVGPIGTRLPSSDVQMTTAPGDIVLYSGNQIVVFYGSNSWAYTKLGRIENISNDDLKKLLGASDVSLKICLE